MQIVELKEGPAGSNVIEFVQLGKNKVLARLEAKSKKEVDDWVKDFKKSKAELTNQTATKESRTRNRIYSYNSLIDCYCLFIPFFLPSDRQGREEAQDFGRGATQTADPSNENRSRTQLCTLFFAALWSFFDGRY